MDVIIWIFIAVIFVILELITTTFFLVWFGIGALAAAILNYLGFDIYVQFSVFVIVSAILILSTRKFANRITPDSTKKTTAERLIGKTAKVIRQIDESTYVVNVAGEEWSAHTNDSINVDDTVKVVGIDSIILIIEKID
ncbi:MAG: NfeD family protein [Methanobrevibacter sp.]|uniref:NfeD family protein n=1 Tax=Methanobrevibacter sp. TaxID=66852 RepID=UPI0025F4F2D4|nr:NfeD family protein [Methanobrevibacter sp.]MBQ8017641.1 NfeD family protein [Methanobrevibacter sp.]